MVLYIYRIFTINLRKKHFKILTINTLPKNSNLIIKYLFHL